MAVISQISTLLQNLSSQQCWANEHICQIACFDNLFDRAVVFQRLSHVRISHDELDK